ARHASQFQALNLHQRYGGHSRLERWTRDQTRPSRELHWWETAAAGDSTLGILALMAVAARPALSRDEVFAIEEAYWPWIEALSTLLDSVVDESEDAAAGRPRFLDYYCSPQEAAVRLSAIAARAIRGTGPLPDGSTHAAIVIGMVCSY